MWKKMGAVLLGALLLLVAGCTGTVTENTPSAATESAALEASAIAQETASQQTPSAQPEATASAEAMDTSFVLPEYVQIQPEIPDSVDLQEYLPAVDMVVAYSRPNASEDQAIGYSFDIQVADGVASYMAEEIYADTAAETATATVSGQYTYDPTTDCLMDAPAETPEVRQPYAGPMSQVIAANETLNIETLPRLFTVTSEEGVYPDCIGVMESTIGETGTTLRAVAFYAVGLGNVLRVVDYGTDQADYRASLVLSRVDVLGDIEAQNEADAAATVGASEDVQTAVSAAPEPVTPEPVTPEQPDTPVSDDAQTDTGSVGGNESSSYDDSYGDSYDDSYEDSYDSYYDDSYDGSYSGSGHHGSSHHGSGHHAE